MLGGASGGPGVRFRGTQPVAGAQERSVPRRARCARVRASTLSVLSGRRLAPAAGAVRRWYGVGRATGRARVCTTRGEPSPVATSGGVYVSPTKRPRQPSGGLSIYAREGTRQVRDGTVKPPFGVQPIVPPLRAEPRFRLEIPHPSRRDYFSHKETGPSDPATNLFGGIVAGIRRAAPPSRLSLTPIAHIGERPARPESSGYSR